MNTATTTPAGRASAGTVYTLLAALGFAAVSTLTTIAMSHGASLWNVLMWRFVIGAIVMSGFIATQRYARIPGFEVLRFIVLGGGGQALLLGLALSSLRYIGVATLAFLFYTYPAWVTVVQVVRGAERPNARSLVALALSFAGIVLIAGSPLSTGAIAWQGIALALSAAIVYGMYIPLMQWMQRDHPVPLTTAYGKIGSAICFFVLALVDHSMTTNLSAPAWMAILGLAVLSTVLPSVFFLMGLMRLGPVRTAIVSTVEPFITALLGAFVLAQPLGANTLIGGAMVVGAVGLLQSRR